MSWPWARTVGKEPIEKIEGRLVEALREQEQTTTELRDLLEDMKRRRSIRDQSDK